ncbi:MAG: biotin/lipoate A/B protein ligase family protein [Candidatus Woesearchaeota archaeon]
MDYYLIPFQYYSPYTRLGLNQVLIEKVKKKPAVYFSLTGWNQICVSIGVNQKIKDVLNQEAINETLIIRRESGGGAVVLTPDDICWGIVGPRTFFPENIQDIHEFATAKIREALAQMGINSQFKPINDIITAKGKISGSAITQRQGVVYVMGTLLYKKRKDLMNKYLRPENDYNKGLPEKKKKISCISELSNISFKKAISIVENSLTKGFKVSPYTWTKEDLELAHQFSQQYAQKEWIYQL